MFIVLTFMLLALSTAFFTTAQAWQIEGLGEYQFEEVNQSVFVMHGPLGEPSQKNGGFMNNPAFIESDNGLIVIGKNETTGRALWEIGYQLMNLLVQAKSLDIGYNSFLLNEDQSKLISNMGVEGPAAVMAI